MRKVILIGVGCVSLSTGIIGIFVPLLPTTPFLLLSAACFLRSSDRLHYWLINHYIFGAYIKNYLNYKAITRKSKIVSIFLLWIFLTSSVLLFVKMLWIKILLFIIAIGVTIHILRLKTLSRKILEDD
jgi:uncharacterized membrane protein YbaN (DUF454 family)